MLAELKIENVAVIEKAEVQFTPGPECADGRNRRRQIYHDRFHQCHSGQPYLA